VVTRPFEAVYREHRETIRRFLDRKLSDAETAEDLTQEVFLRAYAAWAGLRSDYLLTWLHRIAINVYIDHRRRQERRPAQVPWGEGEDWPGAMVQEPQEALLRAERCAVVRRAVETLSPTYAAVIGMRYVEDLPLAEIAARLDVPVSTVKARLHRSLQRLKGELEEAA
jgi:RNA polymerase sigma-70 factor, ECF subfamily